MGCFKILFGVALVNIVYKKGSNCQKRFFNILIRPNVEFTNVNLVGEAPLIVVHFSNMESTCEKKNESLHQPLSLSKSIFYFQ